MPAAKTFIGIEIGGSKLQFLVGDEAISVLDRKRFNVEPSKGAEGIRQMIQDALPELLTRWKPAGLGVGFGGPVDWRTGSISRSHQIEGWSGFEIRPWLQRLASVPVRVDNDADMAALGEAVLGAGKGFDPVFYVTLGSGVGGGLVVNQTIYHGATPGESEIGHVRLDRQGTIVEDRCSGWAIDKKIRKLVEQGGKGLLAQLAKRAPGGEARFLRQALDAGDRAAQQILRETAEDLGWALSHVVHLFHPAVIVIGGGLSLVGEPLREAVAESLPRHVMEVFRGTTEVRLAALGEDSVPTGCLLCARQVA